MADRVRHAVAPAYLLMCLALGGSAQGVWTNVFLQLTGVAIIAWSALATPAEPLTRKARALSWLALAMLAVVIIQLVPLPATLWPSLGGREGLAADFAILGQLAPVSAGVQHDPQRQFPLGQAVQVVVFRSVAARFFFIS